MKKIIIGWMSLIFVAAVLGFAQHTNERTFYGEVADSQCSMNVHSLTRSHEEMLKRKSMGGTPASCTMYCIRYMGGEFVLATKRDVYYLDSARAQEFAGARVKVVGTLDANAKTIHVFKIEREQ